MPLRAACFKVKNLAALMRRVQFLSSEVPPALDKAEPKIAEDQPKKGLNFKVYVDLQRNGADATGPCLQSSGLLRD